MNGTRLLFMILILGALGGAAALALQPRGPQRPGPSRGPETPGAETPEKADKAGTNAGKSADEDKTPASPAGARWQVVHAVGIPGNARGQFMIYNVYTGESYITDNSVNQWIPVTYPKGGQPSLPFSER